MIFIRPPTPDPTETDMPDNDDRPWDKQSHDDDNDRPRRRPRDDDDDYDRPRERAAQKSNGLATASLILAVLALCTGPLTGIPALICGALALTKPGGRGVAITGLVLGLLFTVGIPLLLLPAVWKVREVVGRQKDTNNMKQICLAVHGQNDANGQFIAPYARDNRGGVNRDLSWRVELLPYVEQGFLYSQFDTSQAWNSPRNRPHSNTAIRTYTSPYSGELASTQTPYRVFYGGGALFDEDGGPVRLWGITDGTSNTIMAVHAAEQVPWAEPRELKYSPDAPLPKFGQPGARGFNVAMADGSVRFVTSSTSERTLRAAITRAGGEELGKDW